MSAMRISTASVQPPKYPATTPTETPIANVTDSTATVTIRDTRAPKISRLNMSRPSLSAPSRCSADGAAHTAPRSVSV